MGELKEASKCKAARAWPLARSMNGSLRILDPGDTAGETGQVLVPAQHRNVLHW
jgi:hypothetical protein